MKADGAKTSEFNQCNHLRGHRGVEAEGSRIEFRHLRIRLPVDGLRSSCRPAILTKPERSIVCFPYAYRKISPIKRTFEKLSCPLAPLRTSALRRQITVVGQPCLLLELPRGLG